MPYTKPRRPVNRPYTNVSGGYPNVDYPQFTRRCIFAPLGTVIEPIASRRWAHGPRAVRMTCPRGEFAW